MEWFRKQFEFWPTAWPAKITTEELKEKLDKENDELRKAGNYGKRKGEDLVSKEETTMALEEGVETERILSPKESAKKARELAEKLESLKMSKNKKK